jgi:hypothetical protein
MKVGFRAVVLWLKQELASKVSSLTKSYREDFERQSQSRQRHYRVSVAYLVVADQPRLSQ